MKLDFSATNFKSKVTGWRLSIESKADTLFPTVCDTARGIAGIALASIDQLEHQDPQILARANLPSEDEDSAAEHEEDNSQAIGDDHGDNKGVDDGNNRGVELDGYDKEGDSRISNREDEDSSKASDGGSNSNGSDEDNDGSDENDKENYANGSDLTEIRSSSDVSEAKFEVVPAPGSRRKAVQRKRH